MAKMILPDVTTGYPLDKSNFGELCFIVPEECINLIHCPSMDDITDYAANNATLLKVNGTEQKFNYSSMKVTRSAGSLYAAYYTHSFGSDTPHTFSAYVKAARGTILYIAIRQIAYGNILVRKKYYANGDWQRLYLMFSPPGPYSSTYCMCIEAQNMLGGYFYTDAWQLEENKYKTTWFDGESYQFTTGMNPTSYYWNGTMYNSYSTRTRHTKDGGKIVSLSDLGIYLVGIQGLGYRGIQNNIQTLNDGSGFYQNTIEQQRQFSIILMMYGRDYDELNVKKSKLRQCLYFDSDLSNEPMKLLLQKYDQWGQEAKEIEISCYLAGSTEGDINNMYQQRIALTFDMPTPSISESGNYCIPLDFVENATMNYMSFMDNDWEWSNLDNGFDGPVYGICSDSLGRIWVCGNFTTAGGSAASGIARWDGSSWYGFWNPGLTEIDFRCITAESNYVWVGGRYKDSSTGQVHHLWQNEYIAPISITNYYNLGMNDAGVIKSLVYDAINSVLYIGGNFTQSFEVTQIFGGAGVCAISVPYSENLPAHTYTTGYTLHGFPSGHGTVVNSVCMSTDGIYLYCCGDFDQIGQAENVVDAGGVSRRQFPTIGTTWEVIGVMSGGDETGYVVKQRSNGNIYLGGSFTSIDGITLNNIAERVGNHWSTVCGSGVTLASGAKAYVYDVDFNTEGMKYIVGYFDTAGRIPLPESITFHAGTASFPSTLKLNSAAQGTIYAVLSTPRGLYIAHNRSGTSVLSSITVEDIQEETYPRLHAIGPGRLLMIKNRSNNKTLFFNNLNLSTNEKMTINFSKWGITYNSNIGRDLSYYLTGVSNVDFKLSKGSNHINSFIYSGSTADSELWLEVKKIYDGIEAIKNVSV